jgi:hypothetical protein
MILGVSDVEKTLPIEANCRLSITGFFYWKNLAYLV